MRLDEIDWIFVVAVVCGAIGSVIGQIEIIIGSEALTYFVLALKILSAVLSIAFAIFKFLRLKPFEVILTDKDFLPVDDYFTHVIKNLPIKRVLIHRYIQASLCLMGQLEVLIYMMRLTPMETLLSLIMVLSLIKKTEN
ncbi:hypothetical protein ACSZNU_06235 [Aeromonas hydrophila]